MDQCGIAGIWNAALSSAAAAKLAYGIIGLACIWMGYKLFVLGIYRGGAEIRAANNANNGGFSFSMSKGGPGLVFALFGACVVLYSIANKSNTFLEGGGLPQNNAAVETSKSSPIIEEAIARVNDEQLRLHSEAAQLQTQNEKMSENFKISHSFARQNSSEEEEKKLDEWMQEETQKEDDRVKEYQQRINSLHNRISKLDEIKGLLTKHLTGRP